MKKFNAPTLFLLAFSYFACEGACAYGYAEQPLEQKVKEADIVAYVRVLDPICCLQNGEPINPKEIVAVKILATLKGNASQEIVVRHHEGFVESDPECCRIGSRYLMFLQKTNDEHYVLVNKRFGLISLGDTVSD